MTFKNYNGYRLPEKSKNILLGHIMPIHKHIVSHHVTHVYGVEAGALPPYADKVMVTHHAYDDRVQAVVVEVNGDHTRPNGETYHITVSVNDGAKHVMSNDLLADRTNWAPLITPFELDVEPMFFPAGR